jgi:hypothetical protein
MSIKRDIVGWDGRSSSDIEAVYARYSSDAAFVPKLLECTRSVGLQKGATWLFKRHLESGYKFEPGGSKLLIGMLSQLEHWESKLHILQCLPFIQIGKSEKRSVELFLRDSILDKNKFVRAWGYNGFHVLSEQYPEYKQEAMKLFEMAMRDEAPSVQARIRKVLSKTS